MGRPSILEQARRTIRENLKGHLVTVTAVSEDGQIRALRCQTPGRESFRFEVLLAGGTAFVTGDFDGWIFYAPRGVRILPFLLKHENDMAYIAQYVDINCRAREGNGWNGKFLLAVYALIWLCDKVDTEGKPIGIESTSLS